MTDGTVTQSLEAFFWEPLTVETLNQVKITSEVVDPALENNIGESLIEREVQLVGARSGVAYVFARSLVRADILPNSIRLALESGEIGIGEVIRESGLETFRDIFAAGLSQDASGAALVWRTYRIVREQQAFIKITESFPLSVYG